MQVASLWRGTQQEIELFVAAWRELPENALWLLVSRQREAQRLRARRSTILLWSLGGALALAIYLAVCYAMYLLNPSTDPGEYLVVFGFGFVLPLTLAYLLITLGRSALEAQLWLGGMRQDAKQLAAPLVDPQLILTPLGPRDVLVAALRDLLPALALAAVTTSAVACSLLLLAVAGSDGFLTALALSPLTLAGYAVVGLLGCVILALLMFSLGLNSLSQAQRSFPALLLVLHQLIVLGSGLVALAAYSETSSRAGLDPLAALVGSALLVGAIWLGARLAFELPRLGMTWLIITPVVLTVLFWVLAAFFSLYGGLGESTAFGEFLGLTGLHLSSAWAGLSLFHPGALITTLSVGAQAGDSIAGWHMLYHYPLIILTQCALIAVLYRVALQAANLRLQSIE
jgi:hypothetical protein